MAFLLLVAGNETTVNLIGNGVYALLRHPDQLAALRADRSLMPGAVDELLRYESPVNTSSLRFTTEPIEVSGVVIPEGELVVVALTSANRDESQFPAAGSLDIYRQAGPSLSFGHGIHYCVGAQLAPDLRKRLWITPPDLGFLLVLACSKFVEDLLFG
jgi:cytochrome P450